MKVKLVYNPEFDYVCGYVGGFDDIPTKQDKFKPIQPKKIYFEDADGEAHSLEGEFYISNNKAKENQKKFEEKFVEVIKLNLTEHHPYKNPIQLEVIMKINMSEKRIKFVDVDNIAKAVLDYMKGYVFEDDSQVKNLFATKQIIKDELIPQLSGIIVGVRILDNKPSLLNGIEFYEFVKISDEDYEEGKKK